MSDEISRLESTISKTTDIRQKIDAVNQLAWELRDTDLERGSSLSEEAFLLSTSGKFIDSPFQKGLADSLKNLAMFNVRTSNYAESLSQAEKALSIYQILEDSNGQITSLYLIGDNYDHLGNYPQALDYSLKGLELSEATEDLAGTAKMSNSIGVIYNKIGEYDKELEMYLKAQPLFRKVKDKPGEAALLNNMAMVYYSMGNYPQALNSGKKSLALAKKHDIPVLEANTLCTIGEIYLELENHKLAQKYFNKSLKQSKETGFRYAELFCLFFIAKSFQKQEKHDEAFEYFQQALELAEDVGEKQMIFQSYQGLSEVSKEKGEYKAALEYFEKYHREEKETINEKTLLEIKNLEISNQSAVKQREKLREAEFQTLFEDSPISIWEADCSGWKEYLDNLKESGISDLKTHFIDKPEEIFNCLALMKITNVNEQGIVLYEAPDKDTFLAKFKPYTYPDAFDAIKNILTDMADGKLQQNVFFPSKTFHGKKLVTENFITIAKGYEDTWEKMIVSSIDVTEREHAKQILEESEQWFRTLFEDSPISIFEQDAAELKEYIDKLKDSGISDFKTYFMDNPEDIHYCYSLIKIINVNQATVELYESRSKAIFLRGFKVYIDPESIQQMGQVIVDFAEGKNISVVQFYSRTLTGKKIFLETSTTVAHGHENTWDKIIVSTIDITEREKAKQVIEESEQRFRALFEDSPISVIEEDCSEYKKYADQLRESGVSDFKTYFRENPEEVLHCTSLIKFTNVNQKAVELFGAKKKKDLLEGFRISIQPEAIGPLGDAIADLAEGNFYSQFRIPANTFAGEQIFLEAISSLPQGFEETWSTVILSLIDVTEREQYEQKLKDSAAQFRTLFEDSPIAIWEMDGGQVRTFFDSLKKSDLKDLNAYFNKNPEMVKHCMSLLKINNANLKAVEFFQARDKEQLRNEFGAYVTPDSFEAYKNLMIGLAEGKLLQEALASAITFTGEKIKIHNFVAVTEEHSVDLKKIIISTLDVTEREQIRKQLQESEELYRSVSETATDGITIVDKGIFTYCNPRLAQILGYEIDEIVGQPFLNFLHPDNRSEIREIYIRSMTGEDMPPRAESKAIRKDGTIIYLDFNVSPLDDSRSPRLLTITRDITEQKKLEEQLLQLTITDGLTQISNRRNFFSVAAAEYERVLRHKRDLSIIIFDLDIFKDINDSFGHSAGDVALREIAQLCQDEIRSTDLVARYGGEEFAILLPETNLREAQDLAERLREKIARKTIKHGEKKIKVTISAGVAHLNHLIEISLEELIDQADKALYFSKQNGRNQVNVWEEITSKEK